MLDIEGATEEVKLLSGFLQRQVINTPISLGTRNDHFPRAERTRVS